MDSSKIGELDSVRGIAALLVVAFHLPRWSPLLDSRVIQNGYLMVDLFFVLSGYVIANAYEANLGTYRSVRRFLLLRLGRIYPVHLLLLIAFLLLEFAKRIAFRDFGLSTSTMSVPFHENSFEAFVEQLLLIQAVVPSGHAVSFNGPAWSISVEWLAYVSFAVACCAIDTKREIVFFAAGVVGCLALASNAFGSYYWALRGLSGFFIGAAFGAWFPGRKPMLSPGWTSLAAVLLVAFVCFKKSNNLDVLIYPLSAVFIFSIVRARDGLLTRMLRGRVISFVGKVSYSLYMSHVLVIYLIVQGIKLGCSSRVRVATDGMQTQILPPAIMILGYLGIGVAVGLIAVAIFWTVESPGRAASRRLLEVKAA